MPGTVSAVQPQIYNTGFKCNSKFQMHGLGTGTLSSFICSGVQCFHGRRRVDKRKAVCWEKEFSWLKKIRKGIHLGTQDHKVR